MIQKLFVLTPKAFLNYDNIVLKDVEKSSVVALSLKLTRMRHAVGRDNRLCVVYASD
jgi:hypothetical protein